MKKIILGVLFGLFFVPQGSYASVSQAAEVHSLNKILATLNSLTSTVSSMKMQGRINDVQEQSFQSIILSLTSSVLEKLGKYQQSVVLPASQNKVSFSISGDTLSVVSDGIELQKLSLTESALFAFNLDKNNKPAAFIVDKDLNFDGSNDVGVLSSAGYAGVNYFYDFYLFNPVTKILEKNSTLSEIVLTSIDPTKKQIISTYKSGPSYVTDTYQWNGNVFRKMSPE